MPAHPLRSDDAGDSRFESPSGSEADRLRLRVAELERRLEASAAQQLRFVEDVRIAHRQELSRRREVERAHLQTVSALAAAVEARDGMTGAHVERVTKFALAIGVQLGLPRAHAEQLRIGAILHDVGKIGVPDHVLGKPGPLDDEEWALMRQHPLIGAGLMRSVPHLQPALDAVLHHHERWDGTGYPGAIGGSDISLDGRIIAVADAFDAMTSDRPYRRAMQPADALQVIRQGSGTQFDPDVALAFLQASNAGFFRLSSR